MRQMATPCRQTCDVSGTRKRRSLAVAVLIAAAVINNEEELCQKS
jgi:hypothetical protein